MLEALSMFNDELMELLLEEQPVDPEMIRRTIREATINRDIVPVMMGSAFKNKGVQPLLDAVCDYLPSPLDRTASPATTTTTGRRRRWPAIRMPRWWRWSSRSPTSRSGS
jgi:translation elongation factor EF-G